jgi:hypothetical protein
MRKVMAYALIGGALITGSLGWSGAQAAQVGACVVSGSVSLVDRVTNLPSPLSDVPRKAAYKFIDTNIRCSGTLNANYSVTAQGTTTDAGGTGVGDDCNSAKNDVNEGIYNNQFTATKVTGDATAPSTLIGQVGFTRFGSIVSVQGAIDDPAVAGAANYSYVAELQFTPGTRSNDAPSPDVNQALGCLPGVPGGVTSAALDGFAVVYQVP